MQVDLEILLKVLAPILAGALAVIIKDRWSAKPRLIYSMIHAADHPLAPQPVPGAPAGQAGQIQWARTHSILIRNTGAKAAKNVRIVQLRKPPSIQVWPPVFHEVVATTPDASGPFEIVFPSVAPKESITIAYLYMQDLTAQQIGWFIKSDEGTAERVEAVVSAPWPQYLQKFLWVLLFVGGSTLIYWFLKATVWFLQVTS